MPTGSYAQLSSAHANSNGANNRDSLELASLASSTPSRRSQDSSPGGISSSRKLSLEGPLDESQSSRPRGGSRTYSVASAFDFTSNLFPLTATAAGYTALGTPGLVRVDAPSLEKNKSLTYLNGLSLIVGLIIGSGIFSSPSQVTSNAGSPGASLIVWGIAGVLAWTGAACYAELGGAIPLNGGAQIYLTKIYGDIFGFLFTWSAVFVLKPGSAAIIAIIFGEYIVRAGVGAEASEISGWVNKGVALLGLILVTFLNCVSTKLGTRMADLFMITKFLALIGVTVLGIVVAATGWSYSGQVATDWKTENWFTGTSHDLSSWAVAIYSGLWAFDGWDNTNYVVGEFVNAKRDLPRVIHTAMPLVILAYILANIAYIFVLPSSIISSSNTIAVIFGSVVLGPIGSLLIALTVSMSCFGALNATTFTSGRLVYAAGNEGFLPSIMGQIGLSRNPTNLSMMRTESQSGFKAKLASWIGDEDGLLGYTPINAMVFNALITAIYVVVGEFATLVTFYGVAGYTFYFSTVLGLIVLRFREPNLERPYKTWITTPIIFCCVSLFLLMRAVVAEPLQTLIVVGFVAAGVPVYFWSVRKKGDRRKEGVRWKWKFWQRGS